MTTQPKKTILVVDDEPRMVRFVKMNLDLEGYITLEANNGHPVSYTHLRAHETVLDLVCRLLLEKTQKKQKKNTHNSARISTQT